MGYNVTEGGRQSVRKLKLTTEVLEQIYCLLKDNILTYDEIASKFGLTSSTLRKLNSGSMCYNPNYNYPLRDNTQCIHKQKFGNYHYTGTAIEQVDLYSGKVLMVFPSALAAALALGNREYNKHIAHCCAGKRATAYGYIWRFCKISKEA